MLELAKQKGAYSYEYMDGFEKFFENKLPGESHFSSSLKNKYAVKKTFTCY